MIFCDNFFDLPYKPKVKQMLTIRSDLKDLRGFIYMNPVMFFDLSTNSNVRMWENQMG